MGGVWGEDRARESQWNFVGKAKATLRLTLFKICLDPRLNRVDQDTPRIFEAQGLREFGSDGLNTHTQHSALDASGPHQLFRPRPRHVGRNCEVDPDVAT